MSFIFPKRVLRKGDVLDPTEMNEDYVPASELYSGNLNAHNFNSSTVFPPATNALFTYSYDQQVVGHNMGEAGSFSTPDVGATADAVVISNAGTWEHVISTTITTGNSTLWITGFVQYFWLFWGTLKYDYGSAKAHEFASGGEHNPPGGGGEYASLGRPAAVQFALRIDGRIVEWTITGKQNPYESPAIPLRPANARTDKVFNPSYAQRTTACGPVMLPVRIGSVFPVTAGAHTVSIVARRIRRPTQSYSLPNDKVYAFNRQLFVLEMPNHPQASTTSSTIEVAAQTTEATLSATALGTDAIDATRDALNSIEPGAIARGAFTHEHIASPVAFSASTLFEGTTTAKSYNHYPGFGGTTDLLHLAPNISSGVAGEITTTASSVEAWYKLYNNGVRLEVNTTFSDDASVIVIYANVRVVSMQFDYPTSSTVTAVGNRVRDVVAAFKIGVYDSSSSSWYMISPSEACVSKSTWWMRDGSSGSSYDLPESPQTEPVEVDVPLFGVLQCPDDVTADNITKVAVFTSVIQMANSTPQSDNDVYVTWQRGSLQVFQLKV